MRITLDENDRAHLTGLKAVDRCGETRIRRNHDFAEETIRRVRAGGSPTRPFERAGRGPKIIGRKRIERCIARWKAARPEETTSTKPRKKKREGMRNDDPAMKAIILLAASILSIILTLAGCVIAPGLGWLWLVMLVTFIAAAGFCIGPSSDDDPADNATATRGHDGTGKTPVGDPGLSKTENRRHAAAPHA